MTAYPSGAQIARAYLSRSYNDVDIYVEDAGCQNMYVRLFNRILAGTASITSVFPLGGREALVQQCAKDQSDGGRKRLYVMDADFDLLTGRPVPPLKRLCRLSAYCIENLLLTESALIEVATEASASATAEDLRNELAIARRMEDAVAVLLPLFIVYGVVHELGLTIETTGYAVVRLCRKPRDPDSLCRIRIRRRTKEVLQQILAQSSRADYRAARGKVKIQLANWHRPKAHLISGKSYLMPLAHALLKAFTGFNDSFDGFRVRLAAYCETDVDQGLVDRLRASVE